MLEIPRRRGSALDCFWCESVGARTLNQILTCVVQGTPRKKAPFLWLRSWVFNSLHSSLRMELVGHQIVAVESENVEIVVGWSYAERTARRRQSESYLERSAL